MAQHEFDEYLGLLGRMLRLARSEREGIASELRDHLQERLEELTAAGVSQEEAIARALAEFGDAAVLAAEFIHISRNRKRRWLMRCSMGAAATIVVAALVTLAVWPGQRAELPGAQVTAAETAAEKPGDKPAAEAAKPDGPATPEAKLRAALTAKTTLDFHQTPLSDVVANLKDVHKIEIQLDRRAMEDIGVAPDAEITRSLKGVKLRSALNLMLRDVGLTYTIADGVLLVTSPDRAQSHLTRQICAVEELVPVSAKPNAYPFTSPRRDLAFEPLMELISGVVQPPSWQRNGGAGRIAPFPNRGAIVVLQTDEVHHQVARLFGALRAAHRARVAAAGQGSGLPPGVAAWRPVAIDPANDIDKALDAPAEFELHETPLVEVVALLKETHKIEIQLDRRALEDVGIAGDAPVTKKVKDVTLRQALRLMLRDLDLAYTVADDVLLITTPEVAGRRLPIVLYPVADLVAGHAQRGEPDFDSLTEAIERSVTPDSWDKSGGPATIGVYRNEALLVVAQTADVHSEIARLLDDLRRLPVSKAAAPRDQPAAADAAGEK